MDKSKILYVSYHTELGKGAIMVHIKEFFRCAQQKSVNHLLRLAKDNCTEAQRINLLAALEELSQHRFQYVTQRKNIERCIEKIRKQKWNDVKSVD